MPGPRRSRTTAAAYDEAKLHLNVLGNEHELSCMVRLGRTRLSELVPLARSISASIVAIAAKHGTEAGKTISCQRGCTHCCRQLVPVAPLEAKRLAEVVSACSSEQRAAILERFSRAIQTLETAGLINARSRSPGSQRAMVSKETNANAAWNDVSRRYYELRLDCPFLENDSCSIYDERPIACREYNAVTPPALCESFDSGIETIERPVRLGEALTKAGNDVAKTNEMAIPLPLALEWVATHAKTFSGEYDGEALFWALVQAIEESS
jgi:Fe-S-cluster containining protein